MLKVVERGAGREAGEQLFELDEIARIGARRMLMAALKTEADDYVERHREERDETGRALVVHNGRSQGRKLTLGTGTVELRVPRVNDRRRDEHGQRQRFSSRILPPYMRRSPKVAEVLPILYLRGLRHGADHGANSVHVDGVDGSAGGRRVRCCGLHEDDCRDEHHAKDHAALPGGVGSLDSSSIRLVPFIFCRLSIVTDASGAPPAQIRRIARPALGPRR